MHITIIIIPALTPYIIVRISSPLDIMLSTATVQNTITIAINNSIMILRTFFIVSPPKNMYYTTAGTSYPMLPSSSAPVSTERPAM